MDDIEILRGLANCEDKEQMERYLDSVKPKPMTNADKIRAMDDETLASQLAKVFEEGILALTDIHLPYELLNEVRSEFLKKLKEPVEDE